MPLPYPRRVARRFVPLVLVAAVAAVLPATLASGDDGAWDLAHPTVAPEPLNPLGSAPRGVLVAVTEDTPVTALGVDASFGTDTTLTVEIRPATGATFGEVVAAGSAAVAGGGDVEFHDVTLAAPYTLAAGQRYDVRFQVAGGWGTGGNRLMSQAWNNDRLLLDRAFSVGPITVIDGMGGFVSYGAAYATLPHVRFVGVAADAVAPTVEVRVAAGDNATDDAWYNAASSGTDGVALEIVTSDESGISRIRCTDGGRVVFDEADVPAATLVVYDGFHSVACTATDGHGNVGATDVPLVARVDQKAPVLVSRVDPNPVIEGQVAVAVIEARDEIGVADASCGDVTTRVPGRHAVPCHADDLAGNRTTAVAEYDVLYSFDGFFAPVRMGGDNRAKAGSTVPLKFSLDGFRGLDVLAEGSPEVRVCDASGPAVPAAGKLSYDGDADTYVFGWRTDKAWSGCYEVTVRLDDGSAKSVRFTLM